MITQIRIDGFKSFRRFSLDVPPTLIMLGANGAGKSNLFDALRLVAGTADRGFEETVRSDPRLTPARFFRRSAGGSVVGELTITVGALVASRFGPLPIRIRLRVERASSRRVSTARGSRVWVSSLKDEGWMDRVGLTEDDRKAVRRARAEFLAAEREGVGEYVPFHGPLGAVFSAEELAALQEYPQHFLLRQSDAELRILAARECASWPPFVLEPAALRQPTPAFVAGRLTPDGRNLAEVLQRVEGQPAEWRRFVADLAALVEGVEDVRTVFDERREEIDFEVAFTHTGWLSAPSLSDGTLRMIALLAAARDPLWAGTLCVEEVENGMNPDRVADLVRRLRRGTGTVPDALVYRQFVATTHSPALLAALRDDLSGSLVFLEQADRVDPGDGTVSRTTVARPLRAFDPDREPGETVSPEQVERLLRRLNRGGA
ncbi:AAA family ATPase [Streptomyces sp. NPDC094049]|uniref:AAA family ATPase n=1 Tax=Streptomyces sp. NPDC094049 TaxID=3154987 RepID=UPI003326B5C0